MFAVDIEPAMVAHLTKRAAGEGLANMRAVQASATSPNLPEPVDVVLVVDTFHHIGNRAAYFAGVRESACGRAAAWRSSTSARTLPARGRRRTSASRPNRFPPRWTAAGYVLDARHDFLPRQHFLVYRVR